MLTRMEEILLLSVWKLQPDAYGLEVKQHVSLLLDRDLSVPTVYVPLKRLAKMGYLASWQSDPTPNRGGRRKRFYKLTRKGLAALNQVKLVHEECWSGLPELSLT